MDTWRPMTAAGAPSARWGHTAVWTGTEMLVWGGRGEHGTYLADGAAYDPAADTWRSISTTGAPSPRSGHTALWTGREMLIWGGETDYTVGTGAAYDPATDSWRPISADGAPSARFGHTAVWTGSTMVVWGGSIVRKPAIIPLGDGGRYDPATDAWSPVSSIGAPLARTGHTAIWTGNRMVVWGGFGSGIGTVGDGALYDPLSDTWAPIPAGEGPGPRAWHSAVWTGTQMLVWGGARSGPRGYEQLADGAAYFPPRAPAP